MSNVLSFLQPIELASDCCSKLGAGGLYTLLGGSFLKSPEREHLHGVSHLSFRPLWQKSPDTWAPQLLGLPVWSRHRVKSPVYCKQFQAKRAESINNMVFEGVAAERRFGQYTSAHPWPFLSNILPQICYRSRS